MKLSQNSSDLQSAQSENWSLHNTYFRHYPFLKKRETYLQL